MEACVLGNRAHDPVHFPTRYGPDMPGTSGQALGKNPASWILQKTWLQPIRLGRGGSYGRGHHFLFSKEDVDTLLTWAFPTMSLPQSNTGLVSGCSTGEPMTLVSPGDGRGSAASHILNSKPGPVSGRGPRADSLMSCLAWGPPCLATEAGASCRDHSCTETDLSWGRFALNSSATPTAKSTIYLNGRSLHPCEKFSIMVDLHLRRDYK